jgi:hypothetical protein
MNSTALVVSGGGRFADPWHPFAETSAALAAVLRDRDYAVTDTDDADAGLATLSGDELPSLLVLNLGWHGADPFAPEATDGLVSGLNRGLPTLIVHSTLTAFPDWSLWREITGGGWVYGTTYHPDYAAGVALPSPDHELTAGLDVLPIVDERYTALSLDDQAAVFLEHEEEGRRHPLAWTRTWGASSIIADALGHDAGSYRAAGRAALLQRELDWLESRR